MTASLAAVVLLSLVMSGGDRSREQSAGAVVQFPLTLPANLVPSYADRSVARWAADRARDASRAARPGGLVPRFARLAADRPLRSTGDGSRSGHRTDPSWHSSPLGQTQSHRCHIGGGPAIALGKAPVPSRRQLEPGTGTIPLRHPILQLLHRSPASGGRSGGPRLGRFDRRTFRPIISSVPSRSAALHLLRAQHRRRRGPNRIARLTIDIASG